MSQYSLLITRDKDIEYKEFASLELLARAVYNLRHDIPREQWVLLEQGEIPRSVRLQKVPHWKYSLDCVAFNAEAFHGMSVLDVGQLFRHGRNLWNHCLENWNRFAYKQRHWNGKGPVPGTGKVVRYSKSWLRYPRTQQARRDSCRPLEVDEPKVRAKRGYHSIPSAWDDYAREKQRSWKVQGKRRKAWDR